MSEAAHEEYKPYYDYVDLGQQIKASHGEAKKSQIDGRRRKRFIAPYLFATGLTTLLIGMSSKKDEPIAAGAITDAAAIGIYRHGKRQEGKQHLLAIGSALYQWRLSEASDRITPAWAQQEMEATPPHLLSSIVREMIESDSPDLIASIEEWLEPAADQPQPSMLHRALGRVGLK